MASSGNEIRVPIGVPVETNAGTAADDVGELRDQISRSKDVIRDAAAAMRNLSGKSAEVKAAKDQLTATINREKAALTGANLALIRQGQSYEKLARAQNEAKKKADELRKAQSTGVQDAISRAGGPLARVRDLLRSIGEVSGKGSAGLNATTLALGGLAAAAVATTAVVAGLLVGLGRWAIKGADAARSLQLVREGAGLSAQNAANLGTHVTDLASRVPTSAAALNDLATSLARSGLGGQQAVDALNAVAQASAAAGDSAGGKIQEIIGRGKLSQRMFLGLRELQGTGLDFDDVAKALSSSMKVGVDEARSALLEGRVKLSDGAKAMRDAVEQKFGGLNLRKMMTLEGLTETLSKKFANLTSGINFDKAGQAAFKFLKVFDESTATGRVLKRAVTVFGDGITAAIEKGAPLAKQFIRGMIIGGLELYIGYLRVKNAFTDALKVFGASDLLKNVDMMTVALDAGKMVLGGVAIAVGAVAGAFAVLAASVALPIVAFQKLQDVGFKIGDWLKTTDWKGLGSSIIDGLVDGLKGGAAKVVGAVKDLGSKIKSGFADALRIRSPSQVFAEFGKQTTAGYSKGVEASSPRAAAAVAEMGAPPASLGGGVAGARSSTVTINATVVLQGGGSSSPSQQVQDPGLLAELTKVMKEAAAAAGLGVAAA